MNKEPRLRFTDEERADPALEKPIRKADKAAAKADKAQAKIPKKQVRQKTVDPETGKVTTKLVLEEAPQGNPGDRTGQCGRGERPQVRGGCRDRR